MGDVVWVGMVVVLLLPADSTAVNVRKGLHVSIFNRLIFFVWDFTPLSRKSVNDISPRYIIIVYTYALLLNEQMIVCFPQGFYVNSVFAVKRLLFL